jgi:mycothiol synthase
MGLEFREATADDARFWADVYTAAQPIRPVDPAEMRYLWEHPPRSRVFYRWIVRRDRADVGVAQIERPEWTQANLRHTSIGGELLPAHRDAATLRALLSEVERRAIAEAPAIVRAAANEDDDLRAELLRAMGYREDRRQRRWELDLVAERERIVAMAEASRTRMREQGVRILTLDEDRDPEILRKLWRMSEDAVKDVPTTLPHVEEPFEDFLDWLAFPGMHRDRVWIARRGADAVGISVLEYPVERGYVGTAWTATARSVRGQGVARALKCETLMQAIALGVDRVRTGNDGQNDPILHINASMGYKPLASRVDYLKDLSSAS